MFKKLSGAHVAHHKNTAEMPAVSLPAPDLVTIPMVQHIGAPCAPLVKPTDEVKVGQKIADAQGYVSAPIHASVSGKVKSISDFQLTDGRMCKAIVIESDGQMTVSEDVKPPSISGKEDLLAAIRESGLVGIGGAGFPSHVKLNPKDPDKVDTLLVNAAECEPYITADYRQCMEGADDVLFAIQTIQKHLNIPKAYIGIEKNKPAAIALFEEKTKDQPNIGVIALEAKYPQGAEKVLIYSATGRVVQEGQLPADVGVLVFNVSTLGKMTTYLKTGLPLVSKTLTVDGSAISEPKNVIAPIGTPISDVINFCGGYKGEVGKIIMGGPMMGVAMENDNFPVIKNTNAILCFDPKMAVKKPTSACIRCGRCIRTCPYNLMPVNFERAYERRDTQALSELKLMLCMECGCCEFACPAGRKLVNVHKLGKQLLRESAAKQAQEQAAKEGVSAHE